jgi:hypothetical protein
LESEVPDAADIGWPVPADGDEDPDPMFDSTRAYVEQADRYKEHQDRPTTGKVRGYFGSTGKPEAAE